MGEYIILLLWNIHVLIEKIKNKRFIPYTPNQLKRANVSHIII